MSHWQQIVIGRGTSAMTFLHAALHGTRRSQFVKDKTLVIGQTSGQLWEKVEKYDKNHKMGQPEHLLRPSGLKGDPKVQGSPSEFIKTGDYNKMLGKLWDKSLEDRGDMSPLWSLASNVIAIQSTGQSYRVSTDTGGEHTADQVIIANGAGRGQSLQDLRVPMSGDRSGAMVNGEYIEAVNYMTGVQPRNLNVLVYGGSATASWTVAHAFAMDAKSLVWGARRGMEQIKTEGNPVGRNSTTIKIATEKNMIFTCTIEKIEVLDDKTAFAGRMRVHFEKPLVQDGPKEIDFDQIVYSVGADPVEGLGPGGILSQELRDRMTPVWDNNYRFALPQNPKAITALKDSEGDLWVVGAAVFRGLGLDGLKKAMLDGKNNNLYAKVGDILCSGGRPPEGIAIIDATINALTGYRQTDVATFNWNKANRRDIFQILAKIYQVDIPFSVREKISDEIVAARSKTDFGISQLRLEHLMVELKKKYQLKIDLVKLPGVWDGKL